MARPRTWSLGLLLASMCLSSLGVTPEPLDKMKDDFYELLGVRHDADTAEIKTAYKQLSVKWHPDKHQGKNTQKEAHERFVMISRAYQVLSDHEQREIYDKAGGGTAGADAVEKRVRPRPNSNPTPFDLFHAIFGQQRRRGPGDVQAQLVVRLEDVYNGGTFKLKRKRKEACPHCEGHGGEGFHNCEHCHGTGHVDKVSMLFPGIMMRQTHACPHCHAKGHTVEVECTHCAGRGSIEAETEAEVVLEPGVPDRTWVTVSEGGNWASRELDQFGYGDLHVLVVMEKHALFERNGRNLYTVMDITIVQSLLGVKSTVKHVNGEEIPVETAPRAVTKHGAVMQIKGKGMPSYHGQGDGDLFVQFNVVFPESADETLNALNVGHDGDESACQRELALMKDKLASCSKPCATAGKIPTGAWSAEKALKAAPEYVKSAKEL